MGQTTEAQTLKYGEREIENGELITFPNPAPDVAIPLTSPCRNTLVNVLFLAIRTSQRFTLLMYRIRKWWS